MKRILMLLCGSLCLMFGAQAASEKPEAEETNEEDFEILNITEKGIVFKDASGKKVQISDFEELSLEKLLEEEVVVTGAMREQKASASLVAISVVNQRELNFLPFLYLGDFLATLPGLDVRWGKMRRLYVGARGLGGTALNSRMLLLWDGMPTNDPFTGELNAGHFIPLVDISRIEVIRGPGSTLYGANAFSGVVNVITHHGEKPFEGIRANVIYGSFLTGRAQAVYGQRIGPVHVGGSIEGFTTEGTFPEMERFQDNKMVSIKNDDAKSIAVGSTITYKGIRLSGQYIHGERGRPGTMTTDSNGKILSCDNCHNSSSPHGQGIKYPSTTTSCGTCHMQPHDRETLQRGAVSLSYQRKIGSSTRIQATAHHNEWHTKYKIFQETGFLEDPTQRNPDLKRRASGARVNASYAYRDLNTTVAGTEIRRYEAASDLIITPSGNRASELEVAVFLEDEIRPLEWISLTAGVRYDYSELFGHAVSPRGGIVFEPIERLAFRGSVSRAFRNPSLSELYVLDDRGKYAVSGNPSLKPEWLTSFEGGVSYTFVKPIKLRLAGTLYYTLADDLISFNATGSDSASFFNLEESTILGGEVEIEALFEMKPKFSVFLNYSYQKAENSDGNPLPYAPKSKLNGGIHAKAGRFGTTMHVRVVDSRLDNMGIELPLFATLDATFEIDLWHGMGMQLWAKNLADEQYQESLGIPGAGRSFFMMLSYRPEQ